MNCPQCTSNRVYKNGTRGDIQKFHCKSCGKYFTSIIHLQPKIDLKIEKKTGQVNWRDVINIVKRVQEQHEKASWSQDHANIEMKTTYDNIIIQFLADTHLGSIGTNYQLFLEFTEHLLNTPNLYIVLAGDLIDNFVQFKNMLAIHQQVLSPEQQDEFIESWVKDVKDKILFATWGNHEEMEERYTGRNIIKRILKHNVVYMNGIGVADLKINDIDYKFCVTHKTRYNSSFNITHGLKQLARKDIPNADVYIAGDTHNPAKETAFERGQTQVFIKLGTLKTNDGYSKRYFSYYTSAAMPCVVLNSTTKKVTDFWTLEDALTFANKSEK